MFMVPTNVRRTRDGPPYRSLRLSIPNCGRVIDPTLPNDLFYNAATWLEHSIGFNLLAVDLGEGFV